MTLSEFIGAVGPILGFTEPVLGVLNYLRDRARIMVTLQGDIKVIAGSEYDHNTVVQLISVASRSPRIGRWPLASHPRLRYWREKTH